MEVENTGSGAKVQAKKLPRERKKRSHVWADYEVSRNGDGKKIANCKKCRQELVAESTDGTSHLKRHRMTCPRREDGLLPPPIAAPPTILAPAAPPIAIGAPPQASNCGNPADSAAATADLAIPTAASPPPIDDAQPESSSCSMPADWEEATADLARMIALHGYDPSIVEDNYFKSFVRRLNPDFQVPSRAAIEDICDGVQDDADRVMQAALERNSENVNLVIDKTETALGPVLYIACHFIDDDWNRHQMIVHVNMALPEDMGRMPLFVEGYNNLYDQFHLEVLGEIIFDQFAICGGVFSTRTGPEELRQIIYLMDSLLDTTQCDDVLQTVATNLYNSLVDEDVELDTGSDVEFCVPRQKRENFYSQYRLDHLLPYDKQWYSCYCSLVIRHGYDSSISSTPTNLTEQMCHVWGEIYRAIQTISDPNHPTSHIVLRELFKVREILHSEIAQVRGHESDFYWDTHISKDDGLAVLVEAEETLVQDIKKNYLEWSIPLVLDPRYKLGHIRFLFSHNSFSSEAEEYIFKITEEIKKLFDVFRSNDEEDQIHGTDMTSDAIVHQLEKAWREHRRRSEVTKTELDRYLEGPLIADTAAFDILNWWKLNSSFYPTLARLARASLAMPTSSKLSSEQMSQITSKIRGYSKGELAF